MASVARAIEQASSDGAGTSDKLWWDSHEALFNRLDDFASSSTSDLQNLDQSLHLHHSWLLYTVSNFKSPNASSRSALNVAKLTIGGHTLEIKADFKDLALQISEQLVLDEVQTYILLNQNFESDALISSYSFEAVLQKIALRYFMERQSLLKCTRLLLLMQLVEDADRFVNSPIGKEIEWLIKDGLDNKVFDVLRHLTNLGKPSHMDLKLLDLWQEEIVVEQSLALDILFLLYYEYHCPCNAGRWRELIVFFQEDLLLGSSVDKTMFTPEAKLYAQHVKHQAVIILLEALDFDTILTMVSDNVPFSQGNHAFTLEELQQIDQLVMTITPSDASELNVLLLGWATFLCLISHLPHAGGQLAVVKLDYSLYMRQAHENGAHSYIKDMLSSEHFQETGSQAAGYKSIVKSFYAAFLTVYDVSGQIESGLLEDLVDIISTIYAGQEALCVEFWDRDSIVDGPIRNLLSTLRDYSPYRLVLLLRLLGGLCEGPWPAKCVYDFLIQLADVTCLYDHMVQHLSSNASMYIHTTTPLQVAGAPGLLIPAGSDGEIIRVVDASSSVVHWKCKHSTFLILLLHLGCYSSNGIQREEIYTSLKLICRMLVSSKMLVQSFLQVDKLNILDAMRANGCMESSVRIDVLAIISSLTKSLLDTQGFYQEITLCIQILSAFAECHPAQVLVSSNAHFVFSPLMGETSYSDGGPIAKALAKSLDMEGGEQRYSLMIEVVRFVSVLVTKGVRSESLTKMLMFIVNNLFVDHVNWKYKQRYLRWQISCEIIKLVESILNNTKPTFSHIKKMVVEAIATDTSVHQILLQIMSLNARNLEELYIVRFVDLKETFWFEQALSSCLNTMCHLLASKDQTTIQLMRALLHRSFGGNSFIITITSLSGYCRNPVLQEASINLLTRLCLFDQTSSSTPTTISSHILNCEQRKEFRKVLTNLLSDKMAESNEKLFIAAIDLLTIAAKFQPAFTGFVLFSVDKLYDDAVSTKNFKEANINQCFQLEASEVFVAIWTILQHHDFTRHPDIMSHILVFLSALWYGGSEYYYILKSIRLKKEFWSLLTSYLSHSISPVSKFKEVNESNQNTSTAFSGFDDDVVFMKPFHYKCHALALQIFSHDMFLGWHTAGTENSACTKDTLLASDSAFLHSKHTFLDWCTSAQPANIVKLYGRCLYNGNLLLQAKAEARSLIVGLMVKTLSGDTNGMCASIIDQMQEAFKKIKNQPYFQDLCMLYSAHGFGQGVGLECLILSDMYQHLRGELDGARDIPAGPFKNLALALDRMELHQILMSEKSHCEEFHPSYGNDFVYDSACLERSLGMEWWPEGQSSITVAAVEKAIHAIRSVNRMLSLTDAQLNALESWADLLTILLFGKKSDALVTDGNAMWSGLTLETAVQELCAALEDNSTLLCPLDNSTGYITKFLAAQGKLLLIYVKWWSNIVGDSFTDSKLWQIGTNVVRTIFICLKNLLNSKIDTDIMYEAIIKNLLLSLLSCLEVIKTHNEALDKRSEGQTKVDNEKIVDAFMDVAVLSSGSLPMLCSLIEIKAFAAVSLSILGMLVNAFLPPATWLPVWKQCYPTRLTFSGLQLDLDTDFTHQALCFLLALSHANGGADVLHAGGLFPHITTFCGLIKKSNSSVTHESGPFCVWQKWSKQGEIWGLIVAIIASVIRSVDGDDAKHTTVENAFVYFAYEKDWMLSALKPPTILNPEGRKKARYQRLGTNLSALQETKHVLLLMNELVNYHHQWMQLLNNSHSEFTKMCIHLLAYIAREGLSRTSSPCCLPTQKNELRSHKNPSFTKVKSGWFSVVMRGCMINGKDTAADRSNTQPDITKQAESNERVLLYTEYTDLVAIEIYKIVYLLLNFICKQAHKALMRCEEGFKLDFVDFPELPAPEILYGLQDQVIALMKEICIRPSKEWGLRTHEFCDVLFGIMEKSLYLEVCVSHVCGVAPLSLRSEDVLKEYKAMIAAVKKQHSFLEFKLESLKDVLVMAYPGLF